MNTATPSNHFKLTVSKANRPVLVPGRRETFGVSPRRQPPRRVSFHPEARVLDQSSRYLVLHSRAQAAAPWKLHQQSTPEASHRSFIAYFNETMGKPFRWTMMGKPLAI